MNTRTKWVVAGATSILGLGTVFGAVSAANALDLDRTDDVVPANGIVVGDDTTKYPGSAATPAPIPTQEPAPVPVAPAAPAPAPAPAYDSASAHSAASAASAWSADSAD